jgi:hypothetical protein
LDERNGWQRLALAVFSAGRGHWSSARVGEAWKAVYQSTRARLTVWYFVEEHPGQNAPHYLLTRAYRLEVDGREYEIPPEVRQNEQATYPGVHPYTSLTEAIGAVRAAADADFRTDPIFAAIIRKVPTAPPPRLYPLDEQPESEPPRHRKP